MTIGSVCGITSVNTQGQRAHAYLGIPFAEPPVGTLRWRSPRPITELSPRLRPATSFASACIQPSPSLVGFTGSEDCLYLNVFVPPDSSGQPLPVLAYIHGGGFLASQSNVELDGTALAQEGVIVVTAAYRLGALGFLRYQEAGAQIEGNQALQDQQLALRWIQDNIGAFGGDPDQVTAFGESAGAISLGNHLFSSPSSTDLFRAAIMESNIAAVRSTSANQAEGIGRWFVDLLCRAYAPQDCPRTFGWLSSLPVSAIAQAQALTFPPGGLTGLVTNALTNGHYVTWGPTIGVPPLIDHQPIDGFGRGVPPRPFVFGINANEGAFFLTAPNTMSNTEYFALLRQAFGTAARGIVQYAERGRHIYSPGGYNPLPQGGMTPAAQALARLQTDFALATPNIIMADNALRRAAPAGVPVFGYHFTHQSQFDFTGLLRCSASSGNVCHTDEIPYVWSQFVQKDGFGLTVPAKEVAQVDRALGRTMTAAWAGFAKDPTRGIQGPPLTSALGTGYLIFGNGTTTGRLLPLSRYRLLAPLLQNPIITDPLPN